MASIKLTANTNSSALVYDPSDTLYLNGYTLTIDSNFTIAKTSSNANVGISAVSGGLIQTNGAFNTLITEHENNVVTTTVVPAINIVRPASGTLNFQITTWTEFQSTANSGIQITGTNQSTVNLTLLNTNSLGAANGLIRDIMSNSINSKTNYFIGTGINRLFLNALVGSAETTINGTFNYSIALITNNQLTTTTINGNIKSNNVVNFGGTTNYNLNGGIDLTTSTVMPVVNLKFTSISTAYFRMNFTDGTPRNLSIVADYPPVKKVIEKTRFDFDSQEGVYKEVPISAISLGFPVGADGEKGTAIFTGVIK